MRQLKIATQITNRDSQAVEKYLQEISKISMITPEEETILAQKIKMGDQRALDKLVQANLRFVVSVAKQYQHQGLSLSDLINEGNLGLIKAAQRFDETKGFKFISYAVWWIRQSILQALAEQGRLVRLPQNKIGTYNKANKAYMAFEQEHEREPSTEELAELLEMSETEINNIFQSNTRHTSLDAPVHEAEDVAMGDLLKGGDETDEDVMHEGPRFRVKNGTFVFLMVIGRLLVDGEQTRQGQQRSLAQQRQVRSAGFTERDTFLPDLGVLIKLSQTFVHP